MNQNQNNSKKTSRKTKQQQTPAQTNPAAKQQQLVLYNPKTAQANQKNQNHQRYIDHRPHRMIQPTLEQTMTAWEAFALAKHFPGKIDVPYVAGMNISPHPTRTFKVTHNVNQCYDRSSLLFKSLGTSNYLVILWCPVATHIFNYSWSDKLSGLVMLQSSNPTDTVFGNMFNDSGYTESMTSVYGDNMTTFADSGFVFAGQIDSSIEGPEIQKSGTIYRGCITMGNLGTTVTINDLIEISQKNRANDRKLLLTSAVVNSNIGYASKHSAWNTANNQPPDGFDAEIVDFAVIHRPFVGIESGFNSTYSLNMNITGNMYFRPKLQSALSYGLFLDQSGKSYKEGIPRDIPYNPTKVSRWTGLKDAIKRILPTLGNAANLLMPGSGGMASAIAGLMDSNRAVYIRRDFLVRQLRQYNQLLNDLPTCNLASRHLKACVLDYEEFLDLHQEELIDTSEIHPLARCESRPDSTRPFQENFQDQMTSRTQR